MATLASADAVVQGLNGSGNLAPGWIVTLSKPGTVATAPAKDSSRIYGVVIDPSDAPLALSQNTSGQVFVATGGDYEVLVSTQNGIIKTNDYISMSPNDGIGAKATSSETTVVGRADTSFDGKKGVINGSGDTAVGRILVHVAVGSNPGYNRDLNVNNQLQNYAKVISGRPVSPFRLYVSAIIFLGAFVAAFSLLASGVRNGLISIGRNPLSKHSIIRSLIQVSILSGLIFFTGLLAVYLILKV